MKKNNELEYKKSIIQIITIVEKNSYEKNLDKKLPFDKVLCLMNDLKTLITAYYDINKEECLKYLKTKYIPLINLQMKLDYINEHKAKYLEDLENAYMIGARDDFHCFLIYYEWDRNDKIYETRYSILSSYVYYLNEMAHNPEFELLIVNLPSGYGKTRMVKLYEAWRLGLQPTGTYLDLCSNDAVVKGGSRSVIDIIKSERYGNVFPHLSYQKHGKDLFLKETDGEWKIKDCAMLATCYATTINSFTIGMRASLSIHIDDMYGGPIEALNQEKNKEWFAQYMTVWKERYVKGKIPQVIITGTLWAPGDFICRVIEAESKITTFYKHSKFKYTYINAKKTKVIIRVPALDPITDKSTCEELVSTEKLREKREIVGNYLWETNYQQHPVPPEGLEFDWEDIETYTELPKEMLEYSYAVIDGTRKSGKDFFSMPIWKNYYDKLALTDCIFTKTATSDLIDDIVEKIIDNHIVKLVIESNVDGGLKHILEEKLHNRGVEYCIMLEKYNTVQKSTRIEAEKGNIRKKLVFPDKTILKPNSDMAKFMQNLTLYNSVGRNKNDDAPDSAAMTTSEIIGEKSKNPKVEAVKRLW